MSERILIIEDNKEILDVMADILTFEGYEVIAATDGKEGVNLVFSQYPNLVLTDLQMPDMDVIVVYRILHQDRRSATIPLIFMTASISPLLECLFDLDSLEIVENPFLIDELIRKIRWNLKVRA